MKNLGPVVCLYEPGKVPMSKNYEFEYVWENSKSFLSHAYTVVFTTHTMNRPSVGSHLLSYPKPRHTHFQLQVNEHLYHEQRTSKFDAGLLPTRCERLSTGPFSTNKRGIFLCATAFSRNSFALPYIYLLPVSDWPHLQHNNDV